MSAIPVAKLKVGDKLLEDVYSELGGLIFKKGKKLSKEDIDILRAFLINTVVIEKQNTTTVKSAGKERLLQEDHLISPPSKETLSSSDKQYLKLTNTMQKVFNQVQGGGGVPLLDVRGQLTELIKYVLDKPSEIIRFQRLTKPTEFDRHHSVLVSLLAVLMAKWLNVDEKEFVQIAFAGLFHDIGKTKIDPRILYKKGLLTKEEYEEMKQHTTYGYQILSTTPGLVEGVALAALQHHEREDGTGYPLALQGKKIHLYGKMIAIIEIFHSMITEQTYKDGLSPFAVFDHILKDHFGKLDPKLATAFVEGMISLYQNFEVEMNSGERGKIVFVDKANLTRPMMQIGSRFLHLAESPQYQISRIIVS